MRINFWCGRHVRDGWLNVDAVRHPKAPRDPASKASQNSSNSRG